MTAAFPATSQGREAAISSRRASHTDWESIRASDNTAESPFAHDLTDDRVVKSDASGGFAVTRVWHVADSDDGKIFWHNGGTAGFRTFAGFDPDRDVAVVVLTTDDR